MDTSRIRKTAKTSDYSMRWVVLTKEEFNKMTEIIKKTRETDDGFIYRDTKTKGYIVQDNVISFTNRGKITVYHY